MVSLALPRAAGCADDIGRDSVVTLQRHSCDRRWLCPVYKLVLFGDGTVIYDGIYYVGRKGVIRDHIAPEAFRKLIDSANAIHYFTLKSDYGYHDTQACESRVPDSPLVTTSVTSGENSHGIIHHHRCAGAIPAQLTVFENEIDQAADTARWTK